MARPAAACHLPDDVSSPGAAAACAPRREPACPRAICPRRAGAGWRVALVWLGELLAVAGLFASFWMLMLPGMIFG